MDNVSLWRVIFIFPLWTAATEVFYMDKSGHCNTGGYFPIGEEKAMLKARGGEPYQTKICEITFVADNDKQICIMFEKYDVKDRVNLMIYDDKRSSGDAQYTFGPQSAPSPICSTGRYLTLKLDKENYMSTNYQFEIKIMEESLADFTSLNKFVMSIGAIIAIIIGVVVLITGFAIVIVCCCCKSSSKRSKHPSGIQLKRQSGSTQVSQHPAIEPSAPPLHEIHFGHDGYHSVPIQDGFSGIHEPPPAYSAEPPPYTTTDIPS